MNMYLVLGGFIIATLILFWLNFKSGKKLAELFNENTVLKHENDVLRSQLDIVAKPMTLDQACAELITEDPPKVQPEPIAPEKVKEVSDPKTPQVDETKSDDLGASEEVPSTDPPPSQEKINAAYSTFLEDAK